MPIVTRTLDYARPQTSGGFKCRVTAIDTKGRVWVVGPFFANTLAEAQLVRDTSTFELDDAETNEIIEHVENGNDPETYSREELSLNEMRRRLAKKLANSSGLERDRRFLCGIASYILQFTDVQISNFLGITLVKAQKILDRASRLDSTICPALILDEQDQQVEL
jgi:hypothetical protein